MRDRHDPFGAGFVGVNELIIGIVSLKPGLVLFQIVRLDGVNG
jgi:hypothetical protein